MVLLGRVMSLAFKEVISFYRFRERGGVEGDGQREREQMGDEERGGEMVT